MDTDLLKTFLEVQQTRHFGKAAENLFLTQAAVSARVKLLESELGGPLFTRLRNNLQLTDTGKRLVPHAQSILIGWERARQEVSLKQEQKVILSIGATNGLWDLILQDQLSKMYQHFDEVVFNAESHGQDVLTRRLMERTMDLALVYESAKIHDLTSTQITQAELVFVATSSFEDIAQAFELGYVAVDWGTSFNIGFAKNFQDAPLPVLHTNQSRIALDFLLTKSGCAYLPYSLVEQYLGNQLFHYESAPTINRSVFACYHKENRKEDIIQKVISLIDKVTD